MSPENNEAKNVKLRRGSLKSARGKKGYDLSVTVTSELCSLPWMNAKVISSLFVLPKKHSQRTCTFTVLVPLHTTSVYPFALPPTLNDHLNRLIPSRKYFERTFNFEDKRLRSWTTSSIKSGRTTSASRVSISQNGMFTIFRKTDFRHLQINSIYSLMIHTRRRVTHMCVRPCKKAFL